MVKLSPVSDTIVTLSQKISYRRCETCGEIWVLRTNILRTILKPMKYLVVSSLMDREYENHVSTHIAHKRSLA